MPLNDIMCGHKNRVDFVFRRSHVRTAELRQRCRGKIGAECQGCFMHQRKGECPRIVVYVRPLPRTQTLVYIYVTS